jgi:hypothetical protein
MEVLGKRTYVKFIKRNKMETIFIITKKIEKTSGHGESCTYKNLATYGGYKEIEYPAFTNREDAQVFIDKIQSVDFFKPQITEIKIWSNED